MTSKDNIVATGGEVDVDLLTTGKKNVTMLVRTYALLDAVSYELEFSNHMPNFIGLDRAKAEPDLVWGVYGTSSMNSASGYASLDAQYTKRRLYQIDLIYKVPGPIGKNSVITGEMAKAGGFYNLDRLEVNFRNQVYQQLISYLPAEQQSVYRSSEAGKTIQDLLRDHPMLVHQFMRDEPHCMAMTHFVYISKGIRLRMATVRKNPDRIEKIYVRYHDEIEAVV